MSAPAVEYIKPIDIPEDDPCYEDSIYVACPVCGDPGDYCQDIHHWLCDDCEAPLEEFPDPDDPEGIKEVWLCSEGCDIE